MATLLQVWKGRQGAQQALKSLHDVVCKAFLEKI